MICAVRATVLVIIRLLGCFRLNHGKAISNNTLLAVIDHGLWQMLAAIHHHRWIKWHRILKGLQSNEKLDLGILLDLLNQLFIGEPYLVALHLIPWGERVQLDPAIVAREFATKLREEVLKRERMTSLASVHVENSGSGRLFDLYRRICAHFTGQNCWDSPLRQRS